MPDRVEVPEFMRRAMELRGIDPDEVAAKAATLDLDAPEAAPAHVSIPASPPDDGQESLLGVMPLSGEQLRDEGMARADRAAPVEWKASAWAAIVQLANAGEDFTADDVWARVGTPPEPRALGPLLVRAQKAGMIRNTGQRRNSTRPEHHAFPCAVWEPCQ